MDCGLADFFHNWNESEGCLMHARAKIDQVPIHAHIQQPTLAQDA
jgi:hypothetical protein